MLINVVPYKNIKNKYKKGTYFIRGKGGHNNRIGISNINKGAYCIFID